MNSEHRLILAIQKSGRLYHQTHKLLREAGLHIDNGDTPRLKIIVNNFPMQILYLRDDDIPACVKDGVADAGIVGENVRVEKDSTVPVAEKLGFARCHLSIGIPAHKKYESAEDLSGCKIATSYPNILKNYLDTRGIRATIHEINGSVEIAPGIGLADAIFDIVGSGSTLLSNGLREVERVMESEAVLIAGPEISGDKKKILDHLIFRFQSVNRARDYKYILLNVPNDAIDTVSAILPGMKSPTIMPLATDGWSSLHSVISEDEFWEVINRLKQAGAQGILVTPIEKMIF